MACEDRLLLSDRTRGALLGLVVGDAVGASVEFQPRDSFPPVTDMMAGGPFDLQRGQWTDDTSMALCLAESLIERVGFAPSDQLDRYSRWWREGHLSSKDYCFDIGHATRKALEAYQASGSPYSGSTDPRSAGNGAIMRLAPVPIFFARHPAEAVRLSGESSRTTHGAVASVDASRYFGGLIVGALQGRSKEEILAPRFSPVGVWGENELMPDIDAIACGTFKEKERDAISSSGYVVHTLEAALWAFYRTENFRDGLLLAVNLGDDTDSVGAVYGQIAGAYYGAQAIPAEWISALYDRPQLEFFAQRLFDRGPR